MLVLSEPLAAVHREIDMVTTPDGYPVAMVHCNSCCTELDAWVNMFGEFGALMGCDIDKSELYEKLYRNAMNAAPDCGGAVAYGFMSGEPAANVEKGYPAYFRSPEHAPTLGEFSERSFIHLLVRLKWVWISCLIPRKYLHSCSPAMADFSR